MAKIDFFASLILGPYYLKIMGVTFSDPPLCMEGHLLCRPYRLDWMPVFSHCKPIFLSADPVPLFFNVSENTENTSKILFIYMYVFINTLPSNCNCTTQVEHQMPFNFLCMTSRQILCKTSHFLPLPPRAAWLEIFNIWKGWEYAKSDQTLFGITPHHWKKLALFWIFCFALWLVKQFCANGPMSCMID